MTSAGGISVSTAADRWATAPRTSTALATKASVFTDYYGQQSCTAGRAAFITGQNPLRTGLTKVGMPGARSWLQAEDPTIAEMLKPLGYATGQFGKNHLGDRNEFLPTVHGFDEFFGNLYHLNAEEEPELPDYPKDPAFKAAFGPRGVLHCFATDTDDTTVQPRWGKVGKQKVEDTGPLTKKRMETIDEEITSAALGWMEKQAKADKPFFLWYNSTAMHFRTHVAAKNLGKSGQDEYSDRMVTHDEQIGMMLDKLDELGIADNTIVMYSTDNGPENDTWPDGANSPFRASEGHQLGRRLARSVLHALARQDQAGNGFERHRLSPGHVADVARGGGRSGREQEAARWVQGWGQDLSRCISTVSTWFPTLPERQRRVRERLSSMSAMMAASWQCALATIS